MHLIKATKNATVNTFLRCVARGSYYRQRLKPPRQSNKKKQKSSAPKKQLRTEVDLNEDEDEEMDDSSEETESDDELPSAIHSQEENDTGVRFKDDESNSEDGDEGMDEDGSPEALQALGKYIQSMEYTESPKKRKASDLDELPQPPQQRRRLLKEQTQPGTEGEFASFRNSSG